MRDEMVEVETGLGSWTQVISREDAIEVENARLIPMGTYPGVLTAYKERIVTTRNQTSPIEGKSVAALQFLLNGDTRNYMLFVDAYPEVVKATSKKGGTYILPQSEIATKLVKALGMYGEPFNDVLARAMETTLQFTIGIAKSKDPQYGDKNSVKINAYKG